MITATTYRDLAAEFGLYSDAVQAWAMKAQLCITANGGVASPHVDPSP